MSQPQVVMEPIDNQSSKSSAVVGVVAITVVFLGLAAFKIGQGFASPADVQSGSTSIAQQRQRVEDVMAPHIRDSLGGIKQPIFDALHPVGEAHSVDLNRVVITRWKGGRQSNRPEDVEAFQYEFTLNWRSPLVQAGYSRLVCDYDVILGRETSVRLISTNGLTNDQAQDGALLLGALAGLLVRE